MCNSRCGSDSVPQTWISGCSDAHGLEETARSLGRGAQASLCCSCWLWWWVKEFFISHALLGFMTTNNRTVLLPGMQMVSSLTPCASTHLSLSLLPPADEHNDVQKKTFTKWINARFSKVSRLLHPLVIEMSCSVGGVWLEVHVTNISSLFSSKMLFLGIAMWTIV